METISEFIQLKKLVPSANNPRTHVDDEDIKELAESIKHHGLLQPITVRKIGKKYEIIAGERRFRACQLLELEYMECHVRKANDLEALEIALAENVQRKNMSISDEVRSIVHLSQMHGKNAKEVSELTGKSFFWVNQRLSLANLIEPLSIMLDSARISIKDAIDIARLTSENQHTIYETIDIEGVYELGHEKLHLSDLTDKLKCSTPNCNECPFNSKMQQLFPELVEKPQCMNRDTDCFKKKRDASAKERLLLAQEEGIPFLADGSVYSTVKEILEDAIVYKHSEATLLYNDEDANGQEIFDCFHVNFNLECRKAKCTVKQVVKEEKGSSAKKQKEITPEVETAARLQAAKANKLFGMAYELIDTLKSDYKKLKTIISENSAPGGKYGAQAAKLMLAYLIEDNQEDFQELIENSDFFTTDEYDQLVDDPNNIYDILYLNHPGVDLSERSRNLWSKIMGWMLFKHALNSAQYIPYSYKIKASESAIVELVQKNIPQDAQDEFKELADHFDAKIAALKK